MPEKKLPDELVVKIIDASNNKYLEDFNKQFDKTDVVSEYKNNDKSETSDTSTNVVKVDSIDIPDVGISTSTDVPDFNIDII
jgi:hypothetical protein